MVRNRFFSLLKGAKNQMKGVMKMTNLISAITILPWWVLMGVVGISLGVALIVARRLAPLSRGGRVTIDGRSCDFPPLLHYQSETNRWVDIKFIVRGWFRRTIVGLTLFAKGGAAIGTGESSQELVEGKGEQARIYPPSGKGKSFVIELWNLPYPPGWKWPWFRFIMMAVGIFLALNFVLTSACGAGSGLLAPVGQECRERGFYPTLTPTPPPTPTRTPTPTSTSTNTPTQTSTPTSTPTDTPTPTPTNTSTPTNTPTPTPTTTSTPTNTPTSTSTPTETPVPTPTAIRIEFLLPSLRGKTNQEIAEILIRELKSPVRIFSYPELGLSWLNGYGVELWLSGDRSGAVVIWQQVVAIARFWGLTDSEVGVAAANALCWVDRGFNPITEGWSFDPARRVPCP